MFKGAHHAREGISPFALAERVHRMGGTDQGCTNGRRQAETHGAQTVGGQLLVRMAQGVELHCPHLVLANVRGNDSILVEQAGCLEDEAIG